MCMRTYPALVFILSINNSQPTVVAQPRVVVIATSGGDGACGILMLWETR